MRWRVVTAVVLAGCAHREPPSPALGLAAWSAALAADDPHAAYALLSSDTRARVSEATFAGAWQALAPERADQAAAIRSAATAHSWKTSAEVIAAGRSTQLVREPAGWRLSTPKPSTLGAASPEAALRALADALAAHDADAFLKLLADPLRTLIDREVAARVERLQAAKSESIVIEGDRARIQLDGRYHVDLIRENGQWRIADLN